MGFEWQATATCKYVDLTYADNMTKREGETKCGTEIRDIIYKSVII